jgi:tetratricopeptide (TPR) repeat protein
MVAIPENGELDETSLPRLLIDLYQAQFDGRLELRRQRVEKAFLFASGVAISSESSVPSDSLGMQLMDAGTISRKDYAQTTALIESDQCKEGTALLKLGLIEPRELFLALKEQVRIRIIDCIGWSSGEFSVDPSVRPPEGTQPFRADVYSLVQAGIETHWRADRVLQELEASISRFAKRNVRFKQIHERLTTDDAVDALSGFFNGKHTLWDALQLASTPRAMAAVWVLDAAGALEYRDSCVGADSDRKVEVEMVFTESAAEPLAQESPTPDRSTAPTPPGKMDSDEAVALRDEITARHEQLDKLNYYELLEVEPDARTDEIKGSYLKAAKRYHPDALAKAGLDRDVHQQANSVFALISKAHTILSNPKQRAEYDAAQSSDEGPIDAERLANAESLYRKGEFLLRQGNFKAALEFLRPAVELWPDEAEYCSALGWALYKKMPSEPELSRQHLERALELSADNSVAVYRLGIVLRALGESIASETLLDRARQLDPNVG